MTDPAFTHLMQGALDHDFSGWDFSWLNGRWQENDPPWNYRQLVQEKLPQTTALLDMGTGGGEFLASLQNLPPITFATESYPPNIPIAQGRLAPLGINVIPFTDDKTLPLSRDFFDLVINRHESYWRPEVFRVLKPGGIFLTQQVGSRDCIQLNESLEAPMPVEYEGWELKQEINSIREAGFHILRTEEAYPETLFYDIGAIVFFLKVIEWQIPDFTLEKYEDRLFALHQMILKEGPLKVNAHRFLIMAQKKQPLPLSE